jgi:hypothetical protein
MHIESFKNHPSIDYLNLSKIIRRIVGSKHSIALAHSHESARVRFGSHSISDGTSEIQTKVSFDRYFVSIPRSSPEHTGYLSDLAKHINIAFTPNPSLLGLPCIHKSGEKRKPQKSPFPRGTKSPVPPLKRGVRGDLDLETKSSRLVYTPVAPQGRGEPEPEARAG